MIDDLGQIGLQFDELVVQPNSSLVDRAISEIEIRSNHGFLIVGIRHVDGDNEIHPDPSTKLLAGDVVIVLGHKDDIPELANRFSSKPRKMTYRGVSIEQVIADGGSPQRGSQDRQCLRVGSRFRKPHRRTAACDGNRLPRSSSRTTCCKAGLLRTCDRPL